MRRCSAVIVVVLLMLTACSGSGAETDAPTSASTPPSAEQPAAELHWWNDRVFYEVFVRSFKDSDGDGIGDFAGLTASLDYLNDGDPATSDDLGVTGIWLMPIFPSPSYHGYDVTDYRSINPDYGTMDEFEAFLDAAHARGIAVLVDLVLNHTSIEHPWFTASSGGDAEYRDWYRWSATDPGTTTPWGAPAWHSRGGEYYFGLFWEGMPDLDVENPDVTAELYDVARFWLEDVGVDGFRLDAARHLIEDGDIVADTAETVAWLEDFNAYVDSIAPDALVLGEVWSPTMEVARYVPDALDLAFEFELSESGGAAVASQDATVFEASLARVLDSYPKLQYATFLTNHDMDRIMSVVGGDVRLAELAATWLLTSPGVPFVYYGEEVGLQGSKPDERIRTPMPWNGDDDRVGFTTATPWEEVDPGYADANVADELDDPESLLSHYRTLIHDRAASTALRRGETLPVDTASPALLAYLRSAGDDHVLVVLNLSSDPVFETILELAAGPLTGFAGVTPIVGPAAWAPEINTDGGFAGYRPLESIPPYGFLVLRLTTEPSAPPPATTPPPTTTIAPATAEDAAVVDGMLDLLVGGDVDAAGDLIAPGALLSQADGQKARLDEQLPPDIFDESWDWDGDDTVTLLDMIAAQNAWGSMIATSSEHECAPDGSHVVCQVVQTDVFGDAAELDPTEIRWAVRIADGLIVELVSEEESQSEADAAAWAEQFAAFEQWLADTDPEAYDVVFSAPCCTGTPETMRFTRESIDLQRELIPQWQTSLGNR